MASPKIDYVKARELYDAGVKSIDIAKKLGVSRGTISKVLKKMGVECAKAVFPAALILEFMAAEAVAAETSIVPGTEVELIISKLLHGVELSTTTTSRSPAADPQPAAVAELVPGVQNCTSANTINVKSAVGDVGVGANPPGRPLQQKLVGHVVVPPSQVPAHAA